MQVCLGPTFQHVCEEKCNFVQRSWTKWEGWIQTPLSGEAHWSLERAGVSRPLLSSEQHFCLASGWGPHVHRESRAQRHLFHQGAVQCWACCFFFIFFFYGTTDKVSQRPYQHDLTNVLQILNLNGPLKLKLLDQNLMVERRVWQV